MTPFMTVSELEQWARHHVEELGKMFGAELSSNSYPSRMLDLIADWKTMWAAIWDLLNTDNDLAYGNCAIALNRLRLKP